jgi:hypothetical protein
MAISFISKLNAVNDANGHECQRPGLVVGQDNKGFGTLKAGYYLLLVDELRFASRIQDSDEIWEHWVGDGIF